ncbi:MAG: HyaD/HybD family hydrogenase maturation endopeptidase [Thermodesulfobacteriota bacterium]
MTDAPHVMIMGVGNILLTDEGFGIRVMQELDRRYEFAPNVSVIDGGVLGLSLLGVIAEADYLIVIDAVRNRGNPGDFHRLAGDAIPERVRAKNSLHQIDFLETLTLCQALDHVPETLILGAEPADTESLGVELTPTLQARMEPMIEMVLEELKQLNVDFRPKPPLLQYPETQR